MPGFGFAWDAVRLSFCCRLHCTALRSDSDCSLSLFVGLALLEAKLLIASLLRNFEFELDPNQPPITYQITVTLNVKNGLKMLPKLRA
jgi:hypothetical protein